MTSSPSEIPSELLELVDRQKIYDCIVRYCSGVDRFDWDMVRSVYHIDARDDHGAFVGGVEEFIAWAGAYHAKYQSGHKHYVLNHRCELDGNNAHIETYWLFSGINHHDPKLSLSGGSYLDHFEKRNGVWAIANRKCIIEWSGGLGDFPVPAEAIAAYQKTGAPSRDRSDPSYQLPITVTREDFILPF